MTTGMVLGKFLPPHLGHVYLVDFARRFVDELTVVVGTLRREPIPGALRHAWMSELFPTARVVHLTDENPQYPEEHPDFWDIWRESLLRCVDRRPDYLFASETYGWKLAEVLGSEFIPVDIARSVVPVSGTAIREAPLVHWRYLPHVVRPYFVRRVCVFGPESTGKSTLAAQLAAHFGTIAVPEYARTLLEPKQGKLEREDMVKIARGQLASEEALARQANRLLVTDTDLLTTVLWSETFYGDCDPWIRAQAKAQRYDLTLLLDVDVPWIADPVRYLPDERRSFFDRCRQALDAHNRRWIRVGGTWEERFATASRAVAELLP